LIGVDVSTLALHIDSCQYVREDGSMSTSPTATATAPATGSTCGPADTEGPIPAVACCAPLVREPLSAEEAAGLARVLKAIAEPNRLQVLSLVAARDGGACVCDLTEPLGLSQPTVSHHLKTLVDAGLLHREKRGVWAYFSLVPGALDDVARVLTTTAGR
jgi:ArsR family transcriptional regulator, arsenate/arsenite/antimonite-responsive transcriptional repressor